MTTSLQRGEHGITSYRLGCRCPRCRYALHRRSQIWWATAQLRRGRDPASYADAAPVRTRIAELVAAGLTQTTIARRAGVAPSTVTKVSKDTTRSCSRIVAAAVLGIEP